MDKEMKEAIMFFMDQIASRTANHNSHTDERNGLMVRMWHAFDHMANAFDKIGSELERIADHLENNASIDSDLITNEFNSN